MPIDGKNKPNEDFWQNIASESIYNSSEKITASTTALKTVITWAFGIFAVGGFSFSVFGNSLKEYNFYALISFGIAFFLLTIAYALASQAQYPVAKKFNDSQPVEIKAAFSEVVATQSKFFKAAAAITITGVFLIAVGILIQFGNIKKTNAVKHERLSYIKAGVEKRSDSTFIPVTLVDKENAAVTLSFFDNGIKKDTLLYTGVYYTDAGGRLYYSYRVINDSIKKVLVKATVRLSESADTLFEQTRMINLNIPR
jgi:hypothetical protein